MLDHLAVGIEAEDVDACPIAIFETRPLLMTVHDDKVALGQDPLEVNALAGKLRRHALEIRDERLFSVANRGVVLGVRRAGISFHGRRGLVLVEHQVIKSLDIAFVAFEPVVHASTPVDGYLLRSRPVRLLTFTRSAVDRLSPVSSRPHAKCFGIDYAPVCSHCLSSAIAASRSSARPAPSACSKAASPIACRESNDRRASSAASSGGW